MCCAIGWIDIALFDIFENRNYEYAADQVSFKEFNSQKSANLGTRALGPRTGKCLYTKITGSLEINVFLRKLTNAFHLL